MTDLAARREGAEDAVDYRRPGVWDHLASMLTADAEARPVPGYGRVECPPGWRWRPRFTDYDVWLAVRGRGRLHLGERAYGVEPGTLMFLRPGDAGSAAQDPRDRLTVVYLHLDFFLRGGDVRAEVDRACLPSRRVQFDDAGPLEGMLLRVIRLMEGRQPLAAVEARLLLQQALLEIYRQDAVNQGIPAVRPDARIERATAHLRNHLDRRPTLEDVAATAGLSPGYFSRRFRAEMGESVREYALRVRMERAHHLLEEASLPVGEIARLLGYQEVFLFSRQFKQRYGYPPSHVWNR